MTNSGDGPNVIFLRFHIQTPVQESFVQFDWLIRKTFARSYWLKKLTSIFRRHAWPLVLNFSRRRRSMLFVSVLWIFFKGINILLLNRRVIHKLRFNGSIIILVRSSQCYWLGSVSRRKKGKDIYIAEGIWLYGLRGRLVYLALPWRKLNIYLCYGVLFYIYQVTSIYKTC